MTLCEPDYNNYKIVILQQTAYVLVCYVSNNHIIIFLSSYPLAGEFSFYVLGCEWPLHAHISFLSSYHVYALASEFSLNCLMY